MAKPDPVSVPDQIAALDARLKKLEASVAALLKRPDPAPFVEQVQRNSDAIRTYLSTISEPHGHADAEASPAQVAADIVSAMDPG